MVYFCPQCGTKVAQGATSCPQCGVTLRYVIQQNSDNNGVSSEVMSTVRRKSSPFLHHYSLDETTEGMHDSQPVLKYNSDYINPNDVVLNAESDMSLIGWAEEQPEDSVDNPHEQKDNEKMIGGAIAPPQPAVQESAKYKIVTQVYDKKLGFNAHELETKLNMYAKLGYHIVPNTMICQPGQDFFVLLEKEALKKPDEPAKKDDEPAKKDDEPVKKDEAPVVDEPVEVENNTEEQQPDAEN